MSRMSPLVAALACLAVAAPATAAPTITGKLNKRGYTVVALARDGRAVSVSAKNGSFSLLAPSGTVTVQLRAPNGRYAGPIVVGTKKGKVVLGIRRGARLGKVLVKGGYAVPAKKLAGRFVNAHIVAIAKRGAPIGSKTFGYIRRRARIAQTPPPGTPPAQGPAPQAPAAPTNGGADTDADGVPNALDVDANGNGVLDSVDPQAPATPGFGVFSQLFLTIDQTVNDDAAAITSDQIDAAMKAHLQLVFTSVPDNTELDCGGLSYCSAGGTGQMQTGPVEVGGTQSPFPSCCDPDGNGFGTISEATTGPTGSEFRLIPNATSSQIGTGDTMIERVTANGVTQEIPGTLNFVFNTIPALQSWSSGTGAPTTVSYPVAANGPGTQSDPLAITRDAAGDYTMTMTFWRPQRRAIPGAGEGSGTVDIGGLEYDINIPNAAGPGTPTPGSAASSPNCYAGSISTSDPNLTITNGDQSGNIGRLVDKSADAPSSAANTLTFTVDLTKCVTQKGGTLDAGRTLNMDVGAVSLSAHSVDHANQVIYVRTQ